MASRVRQGRIQIDRTEISARTHASASTVNHWRRFRTRTGFPNPADCDDGRDWWWLHEIDTFHHNYRANRAASFSKIDRRGDPHELLSAPRAAKVLGYRNHRSLPAILLNNPDHVKELPSGRLRRSWYRHTLWTYADTRVDRHSTGRPIGATNSRHLPHPYAEDPRLPTAVQLLQTTAAETNKGLGAQLARQLGISERTGQRLIAAARQTHPTRTLPPDPKTASRPPQPIQRQTNPTLGSHPPKAARPWSPRLPIIDAGVFFDAGPVD